MASLKKGWHSWWIIVGWINQWIHEQYFLKSRDQNKQHSTSTNGWRGRVCVLVSCHCNKVLEINSLKRWKVCAGSQFHRPWIVWPCYSSGLCNGGIRRRSLLLWHPKKQKRVTRRSQGLNAHSKDTLLITRLPPMKPYLLKVLESLVDSTSSL